MIQKRRKQMENLADHIMDSIKTSLIDGSCDSNEEYRLKLLYNDYRKGNSVLANIEKGLKNCESFWLSVAFITKNGLIVLKETLKVLRNKGVKGKILTTDYLNFNDPNALRELLDFPNIEVRVFTKEHFHTKGYMFKNAHNYTFVVGSSNLTQGALKENKEWNIKVTSLENGEFIKEAIAEFDAMWVCAQELNEKWIVQYEELYKESKKLRDKQKILNIKKYLLEPNNMQRVAIKNLDTLRQEGKDKALLISATGTGKTYLAAFDVRNYISNANKPKKVLFLVHRKRILQQAEESFKDVMGESISTGILAGNSVCDIYDVDFLFSTTSMMSKEYIYQQFEKDYFDYIIIDETHRAGADGYLRFLNYFTPNFLLGMTATPERPDGFDVYELFDHNIAYEVRLNKAMEEKLLCPFHYFGITELEIDGNVIDDGDFEDIFPFLVSEERIKHIISKIKFYGYSGKRVKGLMFCRNIKEADELSRLFNQRGYRTVSINSKNDVDIEESINRLEQDEWNNGLDYIFTVDMFNEGIDIPEVNQIVMLRPTQSSIVFVQQLGRGLRKSKDKEYVVVIDFIGNYTKNFLIPIALSGDRTYNKDNIRRYVNEGNRIIPGCSTVNFDEISKKRIFDAIDAASFSEVKLIKEEYFALKNKLGRIPQLSDFDTYDSIDIIRIFDNKNLGSYHNFLTKYDKDYKIVLSEKQNEMVCFISQKLACGKRIHELELLRRLLIYSNRISQVYKNFMSQTYQIEIKKQDELSIKNMLTNEFAVGTGKNTFSNSIFLKEDNNDYLISETFSNELKNQSFRQLIMELIDFGINRYIKNYSIRYKDTDLVLYQKYTYEDVCRILKWSHNEVATNIGGYKFNEETNTFPVFINYEKSEHISETIKYEDRFISPEKIIALSKQPRTVTSPDIIKIYDANKTDTKIYLFVRKNKDDKESKEFYFLGEIHAVGKPNQVKIAEKNAVEITYKLEQAVREDIYDYMIGT